MTFDEWMRELDERCWDDLGVSVLDLPDQPFRDWYDAGMFVLEALNTIREREGIPT